MRRSPGERVVGRRDDHVGILCKRFGDGVQRLRRAAHDGEIDLVRDQLLDHRIAIVHRQPDFELPGKSLPKRASSRGTKYFAVLTTARLMRAALQSLQAVERVLRILERAQDLARARQQLLPGLGDVQLLADALEQRQARIASRVP